MPRRRPPGVGTTTLIAALLVLPWLTTAAQQQQPPHHVERRPSPGGLYADTVLPAKPRKHTRNASNRAEYTALNSQNERALATDVSSAPANPAVRAPPVRNAAPSGGLQPKSARSLKDWEVEDFVLLATVDGRIHATDRYDGHELWALDIGRPMLETVYNLNDSGSDNSPGREPFVWIVEPKEDGALYILTPGPHPVLSSLGMTVKQLTEDLAPYSSDDPPVVYTAEKKNLLLVVDARTGAVTRSFSSGSSMVTDSESCVPEQTFGSRERECRGVFNIGQTEYTVSIHNKITGDNICTIKYSEWTPNNRDRDLQAQYLETMDGQYIYSIFDGHAIAKDHNRSKKAAQRPVFRRKFSSPVARVFDVARPYDDSEPEPALVLLPQPPGPAFLEDKANFVWLNTTETGSWYAMSEVNYPAVTDSAPQALCYSPEWSNRELANWNGRHYLPERAGLVGVHVLDYQADYAPPEVPRIDAPVSTQEPIVPRPQLPSVPANKVAEKQPEPMIEDQTRKNWLKSLVLLGVLFSAGGCFLALGQSPQLEPLKRYLTSRASKTASAKWPAVQAPALLEPISQAVDEDLASSAIDNLAAAPDSSKPLAGEQVPVSLLDVEQEKKVRFDVPAEEAELEALSRTTTLDQESPIDEDSTAPEIREQSSVETAETTPDDGSATLVKKKKTHRGKRGGQRKPRKSKEEEEVDRAVNAAKELDRAPSLHPDEITSNGDDVQDVSNIKKIGKLTIDFDSLLGNGSGGTFVFKGKWNDREVAVKRMLPQYFWLAEQEVKLLQESDLHPNVIRYFDDEKDENFLYIAVELCQASLFDLYRDGRPGDELTDDQQRLVNEINANVPQVLYQLALGLNHLHSLRIIHRDIKPQNILIAYPSRNRKEARLVISDFGLCKTLPDNMSTLMGATGNAGTVGWKAPELILQPRDMERGSSTGHSRESSSSTDPVAQGVKRAIDIFSLGCVFFYVLTNGSHPFDDEEGWMQMRELNIKKNKANFGQLSLGDDSEEPRHLISWMLENRPEARPTAIQVMNHPFFWTAEKRLNFLCDCSDHWEREPREPPSVHLDILESFNTQVLDKKMDFLGKLDRAFVLSLGKQRKYTGDRMLDLLRALRNKKNHYEDMDESVKARVGPLPHGYLRYWTLKFPKLLMSCYECVKECGLQGEPRFKPYFEGLVMS